MVLDQFLITSGTSLRVWARTEPSMPLQHSLPKRKPFGIGTGVPTIELSMRRTLVEEIAPPNRISSIGDRSVRRQGFRDNGLGKLREALAHRIGDVRRPAAGAASGG